MIALLSTTAVLAASLGGEIIYASPFLLPALWWSAHLSRSKLAQVLWSVVAGLVAAEVAHFASAGANPRIAALVPVLAGATTFVVMMTTVGSHKGGRGRSRAVRDGAPVDDPVRG
jgi:hypothetical protein